MMAPARIKHHLGWRFTASDQGHKEFLRLAARASLIILPLQDQGWSPRVFDVHHRRELTRALAIDDWLAIHRIGIGIISAVGSSVVRFEVSHRSDRDGGSKLLRLPNGPCRQ